MTNKDTTRTVDETYLESLEPKLQHYFGNYRAKQFFDLISNAISMQNEEMDWANIKITLTDDEENADAIKSVRKKYLDEVISASVINKRVLGKAVIKYVGNEGVDYDQRKEGLRKLLQATMDYVQTHDVPGVWENAAVTIYDSQDNILKFLSGNEKNKFMVNERKGNQTLGIL
ncbi:unnamed protein product [Mytilus edulis]|uniref:Uncharacterized protein n=1 Tax=Mytilus edulis TaxID=6550 RepID=A0A8S3PUY0_MYTED|nr:unnamed protein product [Mytilus edulis]